MLLKSKDFRDLSPVSRASPAHMNSPLVYRPNVFTQSLGIKTTKKLTAILVYLSKEYIQNYFVQVYQHGGRDAEWKQKSEILMVTVHNCNAFTGFMYRVALRDGSSALIGEVHLYSYFQALPD